MNGAPITVTIQKYSGALPGGDLDSETTRPRQIWLASVLIERFLKEPPVSSGSRSTLRRI